MAEKRITKVTRFRILKPAGDMRWAELGRLLRDAQYRVFRLANLAVSEAYLQFHLFRTGRTGQLDKETIGHLNRRLREMLTEESGKKGGGQQPALDGFSKTGAVPDTVAGALSQYKLGALTAPSKWRQVIRGESSLPTFRRNMALPIRCDKPGQRRLERMPNGEVEVDLMICLRPYPRVILKTGGLGGGAEAILQRLLDNEAQSLEGYRQRCFEVKFGEWDKQWWLYVTYDFPEPPRANLKKDVVVGVDLGFRCPMYVALSNGYARLGWRQFAALAARIRSLQTQTMARRRQMLTGGKSSLSSDTARSGHGRKRKLRSIEWLSGRIGRAYTTLNHQLSKAVIDFALNHGAGIVQLEDLEGLKDELTGSFLGERWRYHQLQSFIDYKATEVGIEVRRVNPRFTSRRCSKCGYIRVDFDRAFRDLAGNRKPGKATRFQCPQCEYEGDPDYNAARNLTRLDIAEAIEVQCRTQGIGPENTESEHEVAN
jgi:IS605 OrfB family transposase